jgi:hypothetical protein
MNSDIRLAVTFRDHRKIKKLRLMIGDRAVEYLTNFWLGVATVAPGGELIGWDVDDIAHEARFEGNPQDFVDALLHPRVHLLDMLGENHYYVHDWEENNSWAAKAQRRSAAARKASETRWSKRADADADAVALPSQCGGNAPEPENEPAEKKARKTSTPKVFLIDDGMRAYAAGAGYVGDLESETESFLIWHRGKGSKFVDWYAAWQGWIRKAMDFDKSKKVVDLKNGEMRKCGSCHWLFKCKEQGKKSSDTICQAGLYEPMGDKK